MVAEQQEKASTELLRDQLSQQSHGVLAELEQENLKARAEYERDQLLLQQYDKRVKELEEQLSEMQSNYSMQNSLRTDQIKSLHEQLRMWRSKYEALAKLYAQLRQEHLGLLQTTKSLKLKAMSAEEAISKREKSEQDLKAKSMELAAIIRERDRALHEVDRLRTQHTQELERLRRD
ncbi:sla2 Src-like adaptor 2, partial [Ascosphaera atra]